MHDELRVNTQTYSGNFASVAAKSSQPWTPVGPPTSTSKLIRKKISSWLKYC